MTEMSPVSHMISAQDATSPVSSIGTLVPNMECKLIDPETGAELTEFNADGFTDPGEMWLRGPNVMLGYLNRPDETAAVLDQDGFLHTGDIATVHRDGYYTIIDRLKELIKYNGFQIAPAELEALLLQHPEISDAAVIGVNAADGQEVPKAFVVRSADSALTADDVMAFVAANVAPHKKVRAVEFIDAVPKSSAGKILRKDLRAQDANR
ncbi:AMP-binding protein [Microbacterium sp. NC79]|uniref:AMP-binding enzyme n=1 Tax=Microbacterium sp. NC79 TaxID=2851009 RepID=UPI00349FA36B